MPAAHASSCASPAATCAAPGSPYRSLDGALAAIEYTRLTGLPLIGTCGGFQHIALEFARNVLGLTDAEHAESSPNASRLFITPLSCSLVGKAMSIRVAPDSIAGRCYAQAEVTENYYCNFGLNPNYEEDLESAGLRITGRDSDGEARILELPSHRFLWGRFLFLRRARLNQSHIRWLRDSCRRRS